MDKKNPCKKKYVVSLLQVVSLVFIALVLPRFFFTDDTSIASSSHASDAIAKSFKLGIENVSQQFLTSLSSHGCLDYRVGLITNHTGIDQMGRRTLDILLSKGLSIKKIFIPEDDFLTYKKDSNWEMVDDRTHISISLLPHIDSLKKSTEYAFNNLDVIFFDLQDTGISPNSYLITLVKALQSSASQNKTIVVLDRPNLLGASMEGMITDSSCNNNELIAVPMRHGMTFGELARHFNTALLPKAARLFVVPMHNYTRSLFADASLPNHTSLLTNIDTYYGSSFLNVLSSVTPFDVGIGTDMAFSCLALPEAMHFPKQKWFELRTLLKEHGIETSWYRYTNPKKRTSFAGLRFLVRNIDQFSPFNTIVTIIQFFKESGITLSFSPEFDRTFGGKKVRDFLEGKFSRHDLEYEVNKGLKNFFNKAHNAFIYKPVPKIVLL